MTASAVTFELSGKRVSAAKDFTVMGRSPHRLDAREKVTGRARYAADVRTLGMLHARILRPPAHGAQDMGLVVNPEGARMQMEGCLTMGLGYVLGEEVRFRGGDVLDRRLGDYALPRFSWVPRLETVLVKNDELAPQGGDAGAGAGRDEADLMGLPRDAHSGARSTVDFEPAAR